MLPAELESSPKQQPRRRKSCPVGRLGGNFPMSQKECEARGTELGMNGGEVGGSVVLPSSLADLEKE